MAIKNIVVGSLMHYADLITDSDIASYGTHCPSHNGTVTTGRSCSDCNHNSSHDGRGGGCWHYSGNEGTY